MPAANRAGRPPKPTSLKKLEGEDHKKRIRKSEAKPTRAYRKAPGDIPAMAQEKWEEIGPMLYKLGLLTEADFEAFRALCTFYALYEEARLAGSVTPMLRHWDKYYRMLCEFGMTPASRTKIDSTPGGDTATPLEELLSGPRLVKK